MTTNKRKKVDGERGGNETVKKLKMEDNAPGVPTIQSKMGMIQGLDDEETTNLFMSLYYSINSFANTYFQGAPYSIARKKDQKVFFEGLSAGDSKDYLKSKHPRAKEAIITAAIWNKLIRPLLGAPMRAFNDAMPEYAIRNCTSGAKEEFYNWRTLTANFLKKHYKGPTSWGPDGPRRDQFVDETVSLLLDHSVVQDEDKLQGGLDCIAEQAYELATAMARSRAYWVCTMRDPRVGQLHGFEIKADRMDDVDLWKEGKNVERSTTVDLVKTPMLLKFGNSNGQNYDQCRVVKKAEVVVEPMHATE